MSGYWSRMKEANRFAFAEGNYLKTLTWAVALVLTLGMSPDAAGAVESGQRLSGDEARASFSVTDPFNPCLNHQVWLSVLVGDVMPLATGGIPSDVSRAYASNEVFNTCTEQYVEFLDGQVTLESAQVEFSRLESFAIHDVTIEVRSERGYVQWFTFNLTWTPTSEGMTFIDNVGGSGAFQVERWVMADVTGSVEMNSDFYFVGQPWSGAISHLTQIGTATP